MSGRISYVKTTDFRWAEQWGPSSEPTFVEDNAHRLALADRYEPMKQIMSALTLLLYAEAHGQNLVPNGSFEEYSDCPPYFGYSFLATGWGGPGGVGFTSPDYFNECHTQGVVGVPSSQFGYQFAADGQAYMGMGISSIGGVPWYRELIGAQLLEPLQIGVPICLSFKTAIGGFGSFTGSSSFYTCKNFGVKFFVDPPTDWESYLYPNSAALHVEEVPIDTAIWYSLSDVYVPDSNYAYIILGNFFADSLSEVTLLDSTGFGGLEMAYAFVDDVRASFSLSYCATGFNLDEQELLYLGPQPAVDDLIVSSTTRFKGQLSYVIRNLEGKIVMTGGLMMAEGKSIIDVATLPSAPYVLQLTNEQRHTTSVRFIHMTP